MSTSLNIIELPFTPSTNTSLAAMAMDLPHPSLLYTHRQTEGRGQRGNKWEAAPGCNLTFSLLLRPTHLSARKQFVVSQAVSVAIVEALRRQLPGERVSIKWPNDIYVDDNKIAGILIENVLSGASLLQSIAGVGLNVNQRQFISDAPNPISMWQILHTDTPLMPLLNDIATAIVNAVDATTSPQAVAELHQRYCSMLWRGEGFYPYIDTASGDQFEACITDIAPTGHITLTDRNGHRHVYAFKEVAAVL